MNVVTMPSMPPPNRTSRGVAAARPARRAWGAWFLAWALAGLLAAPLPAAALDEGSSAPVAGAREPRPVARGRIRVATFNVAWFSGVEGRGFVPRENNDLERIARVLRGTHANLICMQEVVDEDALVDLTTRMNRMARGKAKYTHRSGGDSLFWPTGAERRPDQQIGVVYDQKKLRIADAGFIEGHDEGTFLRTPVHLEVEVKGSSLRFDVLVVHLKSGYVQQWAAKIREKEVQGLLDWMDRREAETGEPLKLVLLGDFNADRDHESLQALDARAEAGDLVPFEDHFQGEPVGTHIPFGATIDRIFLSRALFEAAGIEHGADVYPFDAFLPGAQDKDGFCVRSRYKVKKADKRCDCGDVPDEVELEENAEADLEVCEGGGTHWRRAANFQRVSDHRPVYWDLAPPRRRSRSGSRGGRRRSSGGRWRSSGGKRGR